MIVADKANYVESHHILPSLKTLRKISLPQSEVHWNL